jgi:heptosyltransferase-2
MPFDHFENTNKKHLIVQTAFIGDVFLMVPLLREIRKLFMNDRIFLLLRGGLAEAFLKLNLADEIFEIKKGDSASYKNVKNQLENHSFEYIIAPHSSLRTALFVAQLKAKNKITYREWWNWPFFSKRILKNLFLPEALRQLQLLEPIWKMSLAQRYQLQSDKDYRKIQTEISSDLLMEPQAHSWREWVSLINQLLQRNQLVAKKFVVIFPGSVWKSKQWTLEGFTQLAIQIEMQGYKVVMMGSNQEKNLCAGVSASLQSQINLAGICSLWESILIISKAQLVVCNDSGSMHMAAFAGVPTVAIFGPTVLDQGFRPWQNQARVVENLDLDCRPCGRHGHRECPLGHHKCMRSISWELVFSVCKSYI